MPRKRTRRGSHRATTPAVSLIFVFLTLTQVSVASAHGGHNSGVLSQWHGALLILVGVATLGGAVVLKRTDRVSPTTALYGVFVGIAVAVVGTILFDGLAPDPTYTASSMPFPRSWYQPIGLSVGLLIATASLVVGWLRWRSRPRYTFLGIMMGLWISYPYLLPGVRGYTHPFGYGIVLGTPVLVGYIVWKDAGDVLREALRDPVARRFGIGVGAVIALFFLSMTGYLTFFPEEGAPHDLTVATVPAVYQLVMWPTAEIFVPRIPFFLAVSPAQIVIVGTLSTLIGLNAALIARYWRVEGQAQAGLVEGTGGSAAVVGTCTCGCCGPFVAKIAVLAAGPAVAAPLYWLFVDSASPLSAMFIVGSLVLFSGSLVYAVESAQWSGETTTVASA
jgi:hypothetical protein